MSLYEIGSTITSIAAIALSILIPVAQALYTRFRRVKLDVIPFDAKPLTVLFNESGSYIELKFSISCKNQSCMIGSIDVSATHLESQTNVDRKWTMFKPITVDWAAVGNQWIQMNKATYVHPLRLGKDSLEPLFLEFGTDVDLATDKAVAYRREYLRRVAPKVTMNPMPLEELKKNKDFNEGFQQAQRYFSERMCWREGSYLLELRLHYDAGKTFTKTFRFDLQERDIQLLKQNLICLAVHDDQRFRYGVTEAGEMRKINVATPNLHKSRASVGR